MPQVLRQAVQEGGYVSQPVANLAPQAQHRQAPGPLEAPHGSLGHITVHEKVKSEARVQGVFQAFDEVFRVIESPKRILCANHYFDKRTHRCVAPSGDLVRQILKGCLVSEGKKEQNRIHLLLTGLEDGGK